MKFRISALRGVAVSSTLLMLKSQVRRPVGVISCALRSPRPSQPSCSSKDRTLSMAVDSQAVFSQRIGELNLTSVRDKFVECGWTSHGLFAFAVPQGAGGIVERNLGG